MSFRNGTAFANSCLELMRLRLFVPRFFSLLSSLFLEAIPRLGLARTDSFLLRLFFGKGTFPPNKQQNTFLRQKTNTSRNVFFPRTLVRTEFLGLPDTSQLNSAHFFERNSAKRGAGQAAAHPGLALQGVLCSVCRVDQTSASGSSANG